jgi:hypothetical protein
MTSVLNATYVFHDRPPLPCASSYECIQERPRIGKHGPRKPTPIGSPFTPVIRPSGRTSVAPSMAVAP